MYTHFFKPAALFAFFLLSALAPAGFAQTFHVSDVDSYINPLCTYWSGTNPNPLVLEVSGRFGPSSWGAGAISNVFLVEISNENGVFAEPADWIGRVSYNGDQQLRLFINLYAGRLKPGPYKLRVRSTNPALVSDTYTVMVYGINKETELVGNTVCAGFDGKITIKPGQFNTEYWVYKKGTYQEVAYARTYSEGDLDVTVPAQFLAVGENEFYLRANSITCGWSEELNRTVKIQVVPSLLTNQSVTGSIVRPGDTPTVTIGQTEPDVRYSAHLMELGEYLLPLNDGVMGTGGELVLPLVDANHGAGFFLNTIGEENKIVVQASRPGCGTARLANQGTVVFLARVPALQASNLTFSDVTPYLHNTLYSVKAHWTKGDGDNRVLFVRKGAAVESRPQNQHYYGWGYNNNLQWGDDPIQTGETRIVYVGAGDFAEITGLENNITYHFALFEYNGGEDWTTQYLTENPARNQLNVTGPTVAASDSLALVALYNQTGGPNWTHRTHWLTGPVHTWHGITVRDARVTEINLPANNLRGDLPPALATLTKLRVLDLGGYFINGNLRQNLITGAFPVFLTAMGELRDKIDLSYNQLAGPLPPELWKLRASNLNLSGNAFSGPIPAAPVSYLFNYLNLSGNQLTGTIPIQMFTYRSVRLDLSNNQLEGIAPGSVAGANALVSLQLHNNRITSLPNLNGLPVRDITVHTNQLNFDHLEPNRSLLSNVGQYSPQDSVGTGGVLLQCAGSSVTLTADAGTSVNNRYLWLKDGAPIAGATTDRLVLNNLSAADAGRYACFITNIQIPGLTLHRRNTLISLFTNTVSQLASEKLVVCSDAGAQVRVTGSRTGVTYQAWIGNEAVSAVYNGNDGGLTIPIPASHLPNASNVVTIRATGACGTVTLNGTVAIEISPRIQTHLTPVGNAPCGPVGGTITVANSQSGIRYQALLNGQPLGEAVTGNGDTIALAVPAAVLQWGENHFMVRASSEVCAALLEKAAVIVVSEPPVVHFTGLQPVYECPSAASIALTGVPAGGTFSGTGVSGAVFQPSTPGTHLVTYTVTGNGCTGTSTQTVTVNPPPTRPTVRLVSQSEEAAVLTSDVSPGNQWLLDGIEIAGAVSEVYQVLKTGSYSVKVKQSGCEAVSVPIFIQLEGDTQVTRVQLYPNPATDEMTIRYPGSVSPGVDVKVFNATGQEVWVSVTAGKAREAKLTLNVKSLRKGMYVLLLTTGSGTYTERFEVQ